MKSVEKEKAPVKRGQNTVNRGSILTTVDFLNQCISHESQAKDVATKLTSSEPERPDCTSMGTNQQQVNEVNHE
jgi:hypothetical protein